MSKHFGKYKFSSSFLQFYYQPSWLFSFLIHYNCIRNARVKTIVYEFYLSMIRNLKKWWPLNTSHAFLNCSIWFSIQIVLHVCVCACMRPRIHSHTCYSVHIHFIQRKLEVPLNQTRLRPIRICAPVWTITNAYSNSTYKSFLTKLNLDFFSISFTGTATLDMTFQNQTSVSVICNYSSESTITHQ